MEIHQSLCLQNHGSLRIHLSQAGVTRLHARPSQAGVTRLHARPSQAGVTRLHAQPSQAGVTRQGVYTLGRLVLV